MHTHTYISTRELFHFSPPLHMWNFCPKLFWPDAQESTTANGSVARLRSAWNKSLCCWKGESHSFWDTWHLLLVLSRETVLKWWVLHIKKSYTWGIVSDFFNILFLFFLSPLRVLEADILYCRKREKITTLMIFSLYMQKIWWCHVWC